MSTQSQAAEFEKLKKANSPWFSLEDGESAKVTLRSMSVAELTGEILKTLDQIGVNLR